VNSNLIRFAEFELDVARYELRRSGRAVKLEKIPMDLLILLVSNDGCLVTREEIEEKVWGKGVFVDAEHGINTAMRKVRQALGDDPEQPNFIQTVQRKGYRFIAEVKREEAATSRSEGAEREPDNETTPDNSAVADVRTTNEGADGRRTPEAEGRNRSRLKQVWIAAAATILLVWPTIKFVVPKLTRAEKKAVTIRSIAVLPLENLSGNADEEYFADGMTDELITMLAQYRSLQVTSRTSVMQYKKGHKPLPEIARELGVDGIVEGSVSRGEGRVRVRAQLIYALTDTHLWAESYERASGDALTLQQEVARSIAERVLLASLPLEGVIKPKRTSANPVARDAYYRGRYYWSSDRYGKSREFFQQAIQLDPSYAVAYAGLADSYTAASVSGEESALETMPEAEGAAKKALELDDSLAEAHHAFAAVKLFYRWDWEGAEKESERALELNPSLAEAHHLHAYILETRNHMDEALQEDKRMLELDPFARPWAYGYALIRSRRYDDALKEFKQRSEARPDAVSLHAFLSSVYYYKGDDKGAMAELKNLFMIEGNGTEASRADKAFRNGGLKAVYLGFLEKKKERARTEYVSPMRLAELAVNSGRKEEGIRYLEYALEVRDPALVHLQHDPDLDALHSDTRYWAIVKKMGMPPLR
jgi:TolB-like protein/DNA-binding winged helix-turn-helix (wHTH) protein/Tfp pilus assembly protein PilF